MNESKIRKLPKEKFLETFKRAPRVAVSLWVKKDGKVLLTKRKREPFKGSWHLPGSFVLKGEKLEDCAERVARDELGARIDKTKLRGVFDNIEGDPRGHVVDVIYEVEIRGEARAVGDTAEVGWFKELPEEIGFGQEKTIKILLGKK